MNETWSEFKMRLRINKLINDDNWRIWKLLWEYYNEN